MNLKVPETKKTEVAKLITDLTLKQVPSRLNTLKRLMCHAVQQSLYILTPGQPFCLYVDASDYAVGCVLVQCDIAGKDQ
jgi:hypothetical protein